MKRILTLSAIIMAVVSCNSINPFLTEWENEYRIPDFSQIKEKHYIPAIEMGIRQQQSEIDAIIANSEAPTFENVVVAYERSGAILDRVTNVLFNVSESDATRPPALSGQIPSPAICSFPDIPGTQCFLPVHEWESM